MTRKVNTGLAVRANPPSHFLILFLLFLLTSAHQNYIMLLQVVALAGYVSGQLFAIAQANENTLAIARVGLLGLAYDGLEYEPLHLGPTV